MIEQQFALVKVEGKRFKPKEKVNISKHIGRAIVIGLFLFACYISMDLLNGQNINFSMLVTDWIPWEPKSEVILNFLQTTFGSFKFWWNYITLILFYLILKGLTNRTKLSCILIYIATLAFGTINYIVTQIRGMAVSVSDILSIRTAARSNRWNLSKIRCKLLASIFNIYNCSHLLMGIYFT